jgi:hypothetical protein
MLSFIYPREGKRLDIQEVSNVGIIVFRSRDKPQEVGTKEQVEDNLRRLINTYSAVDISYYDGVYSAEELIQEGEIFIYDEFKLVNINGIVYLENYEPTLDRGGYKEITLNELLGRLSKASKVCEINTEYGEKVNVCEFLDSNGYEKITAKGIKLATIIIMVLIGLIFSTNILKKVYISSLESEYASLSERLNKVKSEIKNYPDRLYVLLNKNQFDFSFLDKVSKMPLEEIKEFSWSRGTFNLKGVTYYFNVPKIQKICNDEKLVCSFSIVSEGFTYEVSIKNK